MNKIIYKIVRKQIIRENRVDQMLHDLSLDRRDDRTESDVKTSGSLSDKLMTFTRITDQRAVTINVNLPNSDTKSTYFEAKMSMDNNSIAIGVSPKRCVEYNVNADPRADFITGWDYVFKWEWPFHGAYSYHGDTGKVWHNKFGTLCGTPLKTGDVVGCGIDPEKQCVFFTLNGDKLCPTFDVNPLERWYPMIALKGDGSEVQINLGKKEFVYQPTKISMTHFPQPENRAEKWTKAFDDISEDRYNLVYDHLKDVTIVSKDGQKIKCHGLILCIRSNVFKKMLEPEKNGGNEINITDFDTTTIKKMIWFMYSDKICDDEIDMDLLGIANMYQLEDLQIVCEKRLSATLDINNVLDAWVGANLFKRQIFQEFCEEFINMHWLEVQKTESFTRLMKENAAGMATLAIKMFNLYANSKEDKERSIENKL